MNVTDISVVAELAHRHNLLLIVDNTFMSPYFQTPLDLGADVVVHSGTKFLAGHNDTLAGFIVIKDETLQEKLRFLIKTTGSGLPPFDSWLVLRGIKTLAIRMEKAQSNAAKITEWLKTKKKNSQRKFFQQVWIGVEPTNDGFADQSLTAWVPHQKKCMFNI